MRADHTPHRHRPIMTADMTADQPPYDHHIYTTYQYVKPSAIIKYDGGYDGGPSPNPSRARTRHLARGSIRLTNPIQQREPYPLPPTEIDEGENDGATRHHTSPLCISVNVRSNPSPHSFSHTEIHPKRPIARPAEKSTHSIRVFRTINRQPTIVARKAMRQNTFATETRPISPKDMTSQSGMNESYGPRCFRPLPRYARHHPVTGRPHRGGLAGHHAVWLAATPWPPLRDRGSCGRPWPTSRADRRSRRPRNRWFAACRRRSLSPAPTCRRLRLDLMPTSVLRRVTLHRPMSDKRHYEKPR